MRIRGFRTSNAVRQRPAPLIKRRVNDPTVAAMIILEDSTAGLSLVLERDPARRCPRLVEEPLFALVTWGCDLGDPHDWPDRDAFHAAVRTETHLIFPLARAETDHGPILLRQAEAKGGSPVGFAAASHEAIRLHLGLDGIAPAIREDVMAEAEAICLGELQALEDYVRGEVYRFSILDRDGAVLETGRDLYGEDLARHVAETAFETRVSNSAAGR